MAEALTSTLLTFRSSLWAISRREFSFYTPNDTGGYRPFEGETHLLFLRKRDGYFFASPCGNSMQVAESEKVIRGLRLLLKSGVENDEQRSRSD